MLERFSHIIQIISGIVLIVGVVLVIWQIRQTERLTQATLADTYFDKVIAQAAAAAGENPMAAYARMCDKETPLSFEDALVLHNLFLQRYFLAISTIVVGNVAADGFGTGLAASNDRVERLFVSNMNLVIATEYGRAWFEEMDVPPDLRKAVEASPYYQNTCEDMGIIQRMIETRIKEKAGEATDGDN